MNLNDFMQILNFHLNLFISIVLLLKMEDCMIAYNSIICMYFIFFYRYMLLFNIAQKGR